MMRFMRYARREIRCYIIVSVIRNFVYYSTLRKMTLYYVEHPVFTSGIGQDWL